MEIYKIIPPRQTPVPIVISIPHAGTYFPDDIRSHYTEEALADPDDTDWFVDRLYDFAPDMGITLIAATHHRWVIDLNRTPDSEPLYHDGRMLTSLCSTTTFNGKPIYRDGNTPNGKEINKRLEKYYHPYYNKVQSLLDNLTEDFKQVLLWDAHSIRQYVPMIRKSVFPDLILGDNDGKTASPVLIKTVLNELETNKLKVSHNDPFKGGNITRHFGSQSKNQHALQLEMTKINYMENSEKQYDEKRASVMQGMLRGVFERLIEVMNNK